jgi:hypothetical protein
VRLGRASWDTSGDTWPSMSPVIRSARRVATLDARRALREVPRPTKLCRELGPHGSPLRARPEPSRELAQPYTPREMHGPPPTVAGALRARCFGSATSRLPATQASVPRNRRVPGSEIHINNRIASVSRPYSCLLPSVNGGRQ